MATDVQRVCHSPARMLSQLTNDLTQNENVAKLSRGVLGAVTTTADGVAAACCLRLRLANEAGEVEMTHLSESSKWSRRSRLGGAVVLLSLGVGCGGSEGAGSTDGGGSNDGAGSTDVKDHADREIAKDVGGSVDSPISTDGGIPTDDGDVAEDGVPGTPGVNLGAARSYVILAKTAVSTVPTSAVTGDIGVSPAAATYITGFSLKMDSTNVFSTSTQVIGKVYASDYAVPTPTNLTTAISDMQTAFTDAAGRAPNFTALGAGNIGGKTLAPGVYKWSTGLLIPTDVTLSGSATDVWIFQVAQNLTMSNGARIQLAGGALPANIFWQVAGFVSIGTTAHFEGVVMTQTMITLGTGASINGRLLAQTQVRIEESAVVAPTP
jgi:hypothetical protein